MTSAHDTQAPIQANALVGRRIAITRPPTQAEGLAQALEALGAQVLSLPAIAIAPLEDSSRLDAALEQLGSYDWLVFTSANGVEACAQRLAATDHAWAERGTARVAAIGPATAQALEQLGVGVDLLPGEYIAEGILAALEEHREIAGKRFLLARADIARETLAQTLRARGGQVDEIAAYRTVTQPVGAEALEQALGPQRVDAITFTSSSTVRGFMQGLQASLATSQTGQSTPTEALAGVALACIGPITAATLREYELTPTIIAEEYTMPGLVRALVAYYAQ